MSSCRSRSGGGRDVERTQVKIEIVAKFARLDLLLQIVLRCRDHAKPRTYCTRRYRRVALHRS